jgi:hypothetical protein
LNCPPNHHHDPILGLSRQNSRHRHRLCLGNSLSCPLGRPTPGIPPTLINNSLHIPPTFQPDRVLTYPIPTTNTASHMMIYILRRLMAKSCMRFSCCRTPHGIKRRSSFVMRMPGIWATVFLLQLNSTKSMVTMCLSFRIGGIVLEECGNGRYGKSTGSPSERGLKIDAETAIQHIFGREELRNSPIILYGQSLGGAVAIYLAEKHQDEVSSPETHLYRSTPW